ncbi:MAG: hypothetical protein KGJ00_18830, partial [Bradyrhizobium sp.]|nr:hypothetical protein [Bradyrhizobium sp.]
MNEMLRPNRRSVSAVLLVRFVFALRRDTDPCGAWQLSISNRSMLGFKGDDDAGRFGFVRPQTRQGRITPAGKANDLTRLARYFRRFGGLQDVKTTAVEKERVISKQGVQLGNRGMAIGKNLGIELAQGPLHLCRIQLHGLNSRLPALLVRPRS